MIVLTIPVMVVPVRIFWEDTHASVSPVNVSTPTTSATSAFLVSLKLDYKMHITFHELNFGLVVLSGESKSNS